MGYISYTTSENNNNNKKSTYFLVKWANAYVCGSMIWMLPGAGVKGGGYLQTTVFVSSSSSSRAGWKRMVTLFTNTLGVSCWEIHSIKTKAEPNIKFSVYSVSDIEYSTKSSTLIFGNRIVKLKMNINLNLNIEI